MMELVGWFIANRHVEDPTFVAALVIRDNLIQFLANVSMEFERRIDAAVRAGEPGPAYPADRRGRRPAPKGPRPRDPIEREIADRIAAYEERIQGQQNKARVAQIVGLRLRDPMADVKRATPLTGGRRGRRK